MKASLGAKLPDLLRESEDAGDGFPGALSAEAAARALKFLEGVRAYRNHPARRDAPEAPAILRIGTTKVRDYGPSMSHAPVVFVVPSLINRFHILDLDLAPSFLRNLAHAGFRPLVVDWDAPGEDEQNFGLADYVKHRLIPMLDTAAPDRPAHILGYCMGGLLALALAALRPARVKSLALLATPWDFHRPDPALADVIAKMMTEMEPALSAQGCLQVDIIQSLFAARQPLQAMAKFADFAALDQGGMEARQFVLLEDWLNDGVPLTANVARECFGDWYGANAPARFQWKIGNTIIDPRAVATPSYVVVAGRDRIVPPESCLPLARLLPRSTLHEPMIGHIGMMAGRNAPHHVWAPLVHWLEEHA